MKRRSGQNVVCFFMKHGEKARTLVYFFAENAMNRVQIKKYTVENI